MIAIWLPMLAGDSRSAWPKGMFNDDPRVTSFWDGDRLSGSWLADHETGGLSAPGSIVWDAYLAYEPNAHWSDAPGEPIVAGSDIIGHTAGLEQFAATLRG